MFKNYLTTALRHLIKYKLHSILTILGLAVGFAASTIIIIINHTEMNYDHHWVDSDSIYQLESTLTLNNESTKLTQVSSEIYDIIKNHSPEVEFISRRNDLQTKIKLTNTAHQDPEEFEESVSLVDSSFFNIFNHDIKKGNLKDFYSDESSVVITQELATKLFGAQDPIGQLVNIETSNFEHNGMITPEMKAQGAAYKDYKVVALIEKPSHKSSMPTQNIFIHLKNVKSVEVEKKGNSTITYDYPYQMYLKTKKGINMEKFKSDFADTQNKFTSVPRTDEKKPSEAYKISFLNIKDAHLKGAQVTGQIEKIWMLFGLAAIILTMACINYVNLALAAYSRRQKEIALRKTLGASKHNILQQFLSESMLIASLALFSSLILLELSMPWLKSVFNLDIETTSIYSPQILGYLLIMTLLVGFISGVYPSFYLSQLNPAATLKSNKSIESPRSIKFRQTLVISQFVISGIMLTSASIIAAQMHKAQIFNPGYQINKIVFAAHFALPNANLGNIQNLQHQLSKIPGVQAVALAWPSILGKQSIPMKVSRQGESSANAITLKQAMLAGPQDLSVFNIKLLAGHYFSAPINAAEISSGMQDKIYINEQALKPLGFKTASEAINQKIDIIYSPNYKMPMTIVGVTQAIHVGSFNAPDSGAFFWPLSSTGMPVAFGVRYDQVERNLVVEQIKNIWKQSLGNMPNTWFIEDTIADEYRNENLIAHFTYAFTGIAIFISCLGLYGLASYATQKRIKEIGLRKIHGASVFNMVALLLWQFSKPVLFANILIWPIALYTMSRWLEKFIDRIDIWHWGPLFCLLSSLIALLIACITVGGQAYLAGREKPIGALREN